MTKKFTVPNARRIWSPRIYKFPNVPMSCGIRFCDWEWYEMKELHGAVTAIYESQGYCSELHTPAGWVFPDYKSFRPEFLLLSNRAPFTAVFFRGIDGINGLEIDYFPNLDKLDFFDEELHVPAVWGTMVIAVARLGIVRIEQDDDRIFQTTTWDGRITQRGSNLLDLFRQP